VAGGRAGAEGDRTSVTPALRALLAEIRYRPPPSSGRAIGVVGHYAGLVRLGRETVAITTDTVGTKTILAATMERWEEVGEDAVAVNVNDLASVGARPAGFVDCLSVAAPRPEVFAGIGRGIDRGLRAARCRLLGGESAVVPELVHGVDLGGTAFGFFPRARRPVTGAGIRPGDELIGIPSSGLHANGLTLARRIVRESGAPLDRPRPGGTLPLGREMLTPTRIYVGASEAIAARPELTGLAHVSGGGVRNLVRLHPSVEFVLDRWPPPPELFRYLAAAGSVPDREMYQTFNMGVGFVLAVRPRRRAELLRRLARAGAPDAVPIGHVRAGHGVTLPALGLHYEGYG
jgi:phosphoribosylformylglycinamidine cyclo-ligase